MPLYTVNYIFEHTPRTHTFDLASGQLLAHEAALHLIELHFGDSESGLSLPEADASPELILQQAEVLGFTGIQVETGA
ncbi:hypothetical protein [Pseudomonas huanghezhanensis]|uniref:hypothetical protein n=1 Tax=Pseudomonas huanghezhanensis TaxID=3002903 RepID=UPI002285D69F|nr:hypothetical protein [Pseudomonas sp. BSw22131]